MSDIKVGDTIQLKGYSLDFEVVNINTIQGETIYYFQTKDKNGKWVFGNTTIDRIKKGEKK